MLYIDAGSISADRNGQGKNRLLNELRATAGLPERRFKEKYIKDTNISVLANADLVTITGGPKYERGFVYINLNGGDSWGYWHPEGDPKVLYNFKGEPNFLLEEVAPGYYNQAFWKAKEAKREEAETTGGVCRSGDISYLAFTRIEDGVYYIGTYDHGTDDLDIRPIGSRIQAVDFLKQYGQPTPEYLPYWSATCDFHTTK